MSANLFTTGVLSVQFPAAPLRGNHDTLTRNQRAGFDSSGSRYVTIKPKARTLRTLIYNNCSAAVLTNALAFVAGVSGCKIDFTFYDHTAGSHTVRLANNPLRWKETVNGHYRIECDIEEVES